MASSKSMLFDLFISYPKNSKWKSLIQNVQLQLRNKYKINFWIDYEQIEPNSDLLQQCKNAIEISKVFVCFLNQDYLTSFHCKEELNHAIKLYKNKIFVLLDSQCENSLIKLTDDYLKIEAYQDLNSFQICKGDLFEMFVSFSFNLIRSYDEDAVNGDQSLMEINNSLKIVVKPALDNKDKDELLRYLETTKRSGGGEILNYDFRNNYVLYLTYKNYEAKQRILNDKKLKFQNYHLTVYDGDDFIKEDDMQNNEEEPKNTKTNAEKKKETLKTLNKLSSKAKIVCLKPTIFKQMKDFEKGSKFEKNNWFLLALDYHTCRKENPHLAAAQNDLEKLRNLRKDGIEMDEEDSWRMTPLHIAAYFGHIDVVNYLIKHNANINKQTFNGLTPLHMACKLCELDIHAGQKSENLQVVQYLCTKGAKMLKCYRGWLPFHYACYNGFKNIIEYFLNTNVTIGEETKAKQTGIQLACIMGDLDLIKFLFGKGADLNSQDIYGRACIHHASRKGHMPVLKFLDENKVDLDLKNGNGETALHYACWYGHEEMVKYLCKNKVDVNTTTVDGQTPLHYAARRNYFDIVDELCHNGANVEISDRYRKTPINTAAKFSRYPVEALLRKYETV